MNLDRLVREQRRLILLLAVGLALLGAISWVVMPRQEDPTFPARFGLVVVTWPGADALTLEERILPSLEDAVRDVPEVDWVETTASRNVALARVQLADSVYETDRPWQDLDRELGAAAADWPAEATWTLQDDLVSLQSILVAVRAPTARLRAEAADLLEDRLEQLSSVQRIERSGDPDDQIVVQLSDAASRRHQLPPGALAQRIRASSAPIPGGALATSGLALPIDPGADVDDVATLAALPVAIGDHVVPLRDIADVRRETVTPVSEIVRHDGQPTLLLGVIPRPGIDVVRFGEETRAVVDALELPAQTAIVVDQPRRVEARLAELGGALLQGVLIVGAVLFLAMGMRLGLVVASIVPLVTMSSLALYAAAGGVLQQISVAGLVLALGLLVDNGIVVAERVQWRLDRGQDAESAAAATVRELALPLASATGTTVAAFVPLLLSEGGAGDFTRAIPQLVMLTLVVSLVMALTVTPTLAAWTFRPRPAASSATPVWLQRFSSLPVRRPWAMVALGGLLVAGSLSLAGSVDQQFFPASDRNELLVSIELSDAAHLDATDAVAQTLERMLANRNDVDSVLAFVGRSVPRFYYNVQSTPQSPRLAQLLVTTRGIEDVDAVRDAVLEVAETIPEARIVPRRLEQGPPVAAPVELRLYGDDLDRLWVAATELSAEVRAIPGAIDVHQDLSTGVPTLAVDPSDAQLVRSGLTRQDVAFAMLAHSRGLPAGTLQLGDDEVPVVVRDPRGERLSPSEAAQVDVWSQTGPVPLGALADVRVDVRPAEIHRRDGQRLVTVSARLAPDTTFSSVIGPAQAAAETLAERHGLRLELGGELEGSGQANGAIFVAAPLGGAMLLGFLLAQFRSFRRVGVVLATVPLAATGVIPGLLIFDQPFGFTSLLGVFALIGIVVNNAIILVDYVEIRRSEGGTLGEAVQDAVLVRWRPILLTTATTIAGMIPLLFSVSTLWPPLASALISGLLGSTLLTLVVVPALLMLALQERDWPRFPRPAVVAAAVALLVVAPRVDAAELTLDEALAAAEDNRANTAIDANARAEVARARATSARLLPKLGVVGTYTENQAEIVLDPGAGLDIPTPLMPSDLEPIFAAFEDPALVSAVFEQVRADEGDPPEFGFDEIVVRRKRFLDAAAQLTVPLVDPEGIALATTIRPVADAARLRADDQRQDVRLGVAQAFYGAWVADQAVQVSERALDRAEAHADVARARVDAGTDLPLSVIRADLEVERARAALATARAQRVRAQLSLQDLTGLTEAQPTVAAPPILEAQGDTLQSALRRPSLQMAKSSLTAARRARTATALGWLPTIEGGFAATLTQNQGFQDTPGFWIATVQARWTLFDGGFRAHRFSEQGAQVAAARAQLDQARFDAEAEVTGSWADLVAARESDAAARRAVTLAEEGHRLAKAAYDQGVGSWQDLEDASLQLFEAQLGEADAVRRHHLAALQVRRAAGVL